MRKVLFKYRKNLHTTEEREGIFHGFFICSYSDSTREVEWTAAFVEDPQTGRVHKLDTDDFRFVDSPIELPNPERSATQQQNNQGDGARHHIDIG